MPEVIPATFRLLGLFAEQEQEAVRKRTGTTPLRKQERPQSEGVG